MSSGARVVTAYAKQTDPKTMPTTGWKILPTVSNGLNPSIERADSQIVGASRIARAGMPVSGEISGTIESELQYSTFDDLIAAALFGTWSAAKPSLLTVGNTKSLFAVSKDFTDIGVYHAFTGCVVNAMTITVEAGSIAKITFDFMAMGYQHSKTASFAITPAAAVDSKPASGLSVGTILKDGADIGVCVESITFTIDNQAEIQRCLGQNMYGGNILAMLANVSGSLKLGYSVAAHDIIVNQLTGATVSLEFPIVFSDTNKYVIKLPQVQVSGEIPSPTGDQVATVDINYTVVNQSPVIERHSA